MKFYLIFLFTFLLVLSTSAQIDSENKSIIIPAAEAEDPKQDNELIITPEKNNSAEPDKEDKNQIVLPKIEALPVAKRKEFSMIKENKFRNPAELYEKQLKNALKIKNVEDRKYNGSATTQFFGEYHTSSKRLNIIYRDHGAQDGDLIKTYHNNVHLNKHH